MNALREQIRSLLRVEAREGGFRAVMEVDPKLIVLPDHFRDHPILPGICMIQAVLLAGAARQGVMDLQLRVLQKAKWLQPVRPGEQMVMEAEMNSGTAGEFTIKAKLSVGEKRCAEISLTAALIIEGAHP